MDKATLTNFLHNSPFFFESSYELCQAIAQRLEIVDLHQGQILIEEGDKNNNIYIIFSGALSIAINWQHHESIIADATAGAIVGELNDTVLQFNSLKIKAKESSRLLCLNKSAIQALSSEFPHSLNELLQKISIYNQKIKFGSILRNSALFRHLTQDVFHALESKLNYRFVHSGQILCHEGEEIPAVYIVIIGRLRLWTKTQNSVNLYRKEISQGQSIGEIGIITQTPCPADIIAIRDTIVAELPKDKVPQLLKEHPEPVAGLWIKATTDYYEDKRVNSPSGINSSRTFALIPLRYETPLAEIAACLERSLKHYGETLTLDSARCNAMLNEPGLAQIPLTDSRHGNLLNWLNQQEFAYRFMIYVADEAFSNWTRRCIHQADHVLFVAMSDAPSAKGDIELLIQHNESLVGVRKSLLLVHSNQINTPRHSHNWLKNRSIGMHHHLRIGQSEDFNRLARFLTGHAIALVLGGGGARGFAHIGVIKAMSELNIPIDLIGGTSMGALIGAQCAMQRTPQEILKNTLSLCKAGEQFTIPLVSLMRGAQFHNGLKKMLGDSHIEDLWRHFFCVSCNLSEADQLVHDSGSLVDAVLASNSPPGLFPPKYDPRGLLVDGALLNNVPFDVMQRYNEGGLTLVVDVDPERDLPANTPYQSGLSGLQILLNKLNPFQDRMDIPNIKDIIMRSISIGGLFYQRNQQISKRADLYLAPPVANIPMMAYAKGAAIANIGYNYAHQQLEHWLQENSDRIL
jgi:NTE family protein/lysophospholipid hydrolase